MQPLLVEQKSVVLIQRAADFFVLLPQVVSFGAGLGTEDVVDGIVQVCVVCQPFLHLIQLMLKGMGPVMSDGRRPRRIGAKKCLKGRSKAPQTPTDAPLQTRLADCNVINRSTVAAIYASGKQTDKHLRTLAIADQGDFSLVGNNKFRATHSTTLSFRAGLSNKQFEAVRFIVIPDDWSDPNGGGVPNVILGYPCVRIR